MRSAEGVARGLATSIVEKTDFRSMTPFSTIRGILQLKHTLSCPLTHVQGAWHEGQFPLTTEALTHRLTRLTPTMPTTGTTSTRRKKKFI